jgi:UDP-3-O-acyl N-acetylglucosamine deacetylase
MRTLVIEQQCTLARVVEMTGKGLFLGEQVRLRCLPAKLDSGIVFIRTDLPDAPRIPATLENVPGPQRWTALRSGEAEVRMVEHLLATCCGLGIDNMIVETDSVEMPIGDGSAKSYADAFLNAGVKPQDAARCARVLSHPVAAMDGDSLLSAVPQKAGLTLTYVLDYGRHFIKSQAYTATITRDVFVSEIAPARTYVLRPEVDAFIKLGLGRGATPENTLVLEEDGRVAGDLRFPDECARHKVLDMLGDLFLTGRPAPLRAIGYKTGHSTNVRLAKALAEAYVPESPR